jgi:hypothetical protein
MPDIPDRISEEALRSYLGDASSFPTASAAPEYNLQGIEPGVLDFSIALQSIIQASGGVSMVQLSQAALFLLSAMSSLNESVLDAVSNDDSSEVPPAAKAVVLQKIKHDIKVTAAVTALLESVCNPVMEATVFHKIQLSGRAPTAHLVRQCLVSDDICKRLGLSLGEVAVYFEDAIRKMVDR